MNSNYVDKYMRILLSVQKWYIEIRHITEMVDIYVYMIICVFSYNRHKWHIYKISNNTCMTCDIKCEILKYLFYRYTYKFILYPYNLQRLIFHEWMRGGNLSGEYAARTIEFSIWSCNR